ncbi:DDE-type integrase/transposase/recombinase [[Mycobacterium] zoologicum]|uniref:DDE-type integrase/transposase/recombinase n=1 Tax=[Mycobacterium] zoologicum TaxID=2872311 RepID=UPI002BEEDB5B|nr:DDE-type integrase/transposase/recombinase [Mycolicibacter sp. MYC101]MEB3065318.1 DDE-type integrase/transposase/recombinase [Mycolicibacter sp. MYC101]
MGRNFTADAPGRRLVGDITHIRTWEGWLYLATVLDCFAKKVLGYAMAGHMRTELVSDALVMAARNCAFTAGETIFHSDRGTQYLSMEFAALTKELGVLRSNTVPDARARKKGYRPLHRIAIQPDSTPFHDCISHTE